MADASGITLDDSLGAMKSNCCGLVAANVSAVSTSWPVAEASIPLSQSTYRKGVDIAKHDITGEK